MTCPPSKRLRGLNQDIPKADPFEADPFGDDDDFTQDDLDEIDTIASQAIGLTSASATGPGWERAHGSGFRPPLDRENTGGFGGKSGHSGARSREPLGNRAQQIGADREDSYILLEAQHADLRRKLKEVEEEIVLKNGEIRVLRDSLRGARQEKETQRQTLALLEKQKQREQSDKEKELNKKVQSLRSELQFKEAEINEMKSKLLSAERSKPASPLPRNSPKVPNGLSQLHRGGSSSSPTGSGFITKETFAAHLPSRNASIKTPAKTRRDGAVNKQEVAWTDPFQCDRPAHRQHRGGVLLGLLLQQPLSPSSLCLSHLLSVSLSDTCLTARPDSTAAQWDLSAAGAGRMICGAPRVGLSPVQSLAVTGLNMLSQSRPGAAKAKHGCPGAVLLLPLLDLHLSRLCQALDARGAASGSLPDTRPAPTGPGRPDEAVASGDSLEDAGLAALRILYLLTDHSDEVVQAVLSTQSEGSTENQAATAVATQALDSHNALLQSVLHLCRVSGAGGELEEIVVGAVKAASALIERAPDAHVDRLPRLLQALCACVSAHANPRVLAECTAALVRACDRASLPRQLCSQHEPCVFLKLLQHIRNRPVKQGSHAELIQLDLQVVRLFNRLTQTAESWQSSSCQCYTELVQTSVVILHRQWLDLRDSPERTAGSPDPDVGPSWSAPWWRRPPASLLRECLHLLHWLLHHHASFSASCRSLLHMYDQAVPAVRDTLRKIPELSESEELALEEICRPEGDDTDDQDTDSGS
ncbi:ATR-interacting protein [Phycodurus eques]|uniref:ATR-interacting protein n=1 Tax=Phycodurus eques TaxID=693459 RepID=UPI002ACD785F|nr:ATR-interacting protein [Phycodurus eques]